MNTQKIWWAAWWVFAAAIFLGCLAHPPRASADCDPRYDSCESPRWCPTTGTMLPPLSGYCPTGPINYPAPPNWTGSDG